MDSNTRTLVIRTANIMSRARRPLAAETLRELVRVDSPDAARIETALKMALDEVDADTAGKIYQMVGQRTKAA